MKDKKKLIISILLVIGLVIVTLSVSYAAFIFRDTTSNQQLVLGDIYMYYNETNTLSIDNALPGDPYTSYFEFTISGKNESRKNIYYEIIVNNGDLPDNQTEQNRLPAKFLQFKLVEVVDEVEHEIFADKSFSDLNNKQLHIEVIGANLDTEISTKYRLYARISDNILIGNIAEADYTSEEWANVFASINVSVKGDLNEKFMPASDANSFKALAIAKNSSVCPTYLEEDEITYISGSQDCIDFNYVWYSGKLWRITAINPDGTMKMITEDVMTMLSFGNPPVFYTDEDTTSEIYQWLNQEFLPTLYNYKEIVVEDATWNASTGNGQISDKLPVEGQDEMYVPATVGLLNSYEYYMSYQNTIASSGYLNVGYYWYLLNQVSTTFPSVWRVDNVGGLDKGAFAMNGVRPSVYLKSTIQFISGTGSINDPYIIKYDQGEAVPNSTLLSSRQSGEYVKLENDETASMFRILDVDVVSTKLILNDYVKDTDGAILQKTFGTTTAWNEVSQTDETYWRGYLNTVWLEAIDNTYDAEAGISNILAKGTYYLGQMLYSDGWTYKLTVCNTVNNKKSVKNCIAENTVQMSVTDYVGLPRYAEIFASQFGSGYTNSVFEVFVTEDQWSGIIGIQPSGYMQMGNYVDPPNTGAVRPTINLKSNIVIKSGSGTELDPFVVGLPS